MEPPIETTPRPLSRDVPRADPHSSKPSTRTFRAALAILPREWTWHSLLPLFCALITAICLAAAIVWSRHWPLFHDAAIMHYVVFLMDHGWRPYVDIVDINMPASYMVEWFAVHVFGPDSVAWRLFDVTTMVVVLASSVLIADRKNRLAGFIGGMAIVLFHLSNGPADVGERDWSLMVFLLAAFAFYVRSLRGRRPVLFIGFAALSGWAAAIKPPAFPFPFALLLLACWVLRKDRQQLRPWLLAALAGACVPAAAVLLFLWHYHAFAAFLTIARGLIPFYATSGNLPLPYLLHVALGVYLLGIALVAAYVCWQQGSWRLWETQVQLLGIFFGAFLYFSQRKGWQQHKETLFAFLLLWIAMQFSTGLRATAPALRTRVTSALGFGLLTLLLVRWTLPVRNFPFYIPGAAAIEADLRPMGTPSLSRNVQCVEMVSGCIHALYDLRVQPSTGFLFDSFLFTAMPDQAVLALRARFLAELAQQPPAVLIVGASDWEAGSVSYSRLVRWPAFQQFLDSRYSLRHEYNAGPTIERGSYRLYDRK